MAERPLQASGATPGPWRWMSDTALVGDHGHRPVVLTSFRDKALMTRGETGRLEALKPEHPNALLIAAAPEMREALRETLELSQHADGCRWFDIPIGELNDSEASQQRQAAACNCHLKAVRAAIAKAEGRS